MKRPILVIVVFCILLSIPCLCSSSDTMQLAVSLYKWNYFNDCIKELDKLIAEGTQPWEGRARFLKAYCLIKKGDKSGAEWIFEALSKDPNYPLYDYAKFALGDIYFSSRDFEKASDHYGDIFSDSALKIDADIKRAECLFELGKYDQAVNVYMGVIVNNPSSPSLDRARFNLGKCYERMSSPKEAIKAYHEVNLYHPLSPLVKECVSRINGLSRKYKISPNSASAEDLFNKAMVFYNFGDSASAGMFFNQIVSNYRGSELWDDALFKLAMCDYKRRRFRSSIARFKICADRGGTNAAAAQFYIGFAYGKGGYFYQALDSLRKVTNNYPNSEYADDAAYYLGYYYEANGFKDNALSCYQDFVARYPKSEFADDAYWKIGRTLYNNKYYSAAADMFNKALNGCSDASMLDACSYWLALSQEKMGNPTEAAALYQLVILRYDHTYYSYRAREKLRGLGMEVKEAATPIVDTSPAQEYYAQTDDTTFAEEPLPFEGYDEDDKYPTLQTSSTKITNLNEHFMKYTELMSIGFYEHAATEAEMLIQNSPADKRMSAKLALASAQLASGKIRDSIIYAETLCNNSVLKGTFRELPQITWQLAYPKGYYKHVSQYAREFGIDECLVLAVIREESRFNPKTISSANARGLMQMIPTTGRNVARLVGIRNYYTAKLHDPDVNIKMGCYYLSQLLKRFDNNPAFALAAYNGGPLRVKRWMNKWQNDMGTDIDIDEFVENIPLSETRRYVQKVLKSYYEYKRLYSTKPADEG